MVLNLYLDHAWYQKEKMIKRLRIAAKKRIIRADELNRNPQINLNVFIAETGEPFVFYTRFQVAVGALSFDLAIL